MERKTESNFPSEKATENNFASQKPTAEAQAPIDVMKTPTEKILDQISVEIKDMEKRNNTNTNAQNPGNPAPISNPNTHHSISQLLPFKPTKKINFSRRQRNKYTIIIFVTAAILLIIGIVFLLMFLGVVKV